MVIDDHLTTHCWFNYANYYTWLANRPGINTVAEVGVWKGHSIVFLAQKLLAAKKQFKLYAVDIWDAWADQGPNVPVSSADMPKFLDEVRHVYDIYTKNLVLANVRQYITDVKLSSHLAPAEFKDGYFDAVFIDANHTYPYIKRDIELWYPKVRAGGVISGHDYNNDVKRAVDECVPQVSTMGTVWYHIKTGSLKA